MNHSNPKVAVVILNWNGAALLEKFLPSVVQSQYPALEIWVIDNASTDHSKQVVAQFNQIKYLQLSQNYGFTGGYNRALQQIDATYFVLLNSDVEVTPNWITPIINLMQAHPNIGACQPKILAYHQKTHFEYAGASGGYIDNLGFPFCRGRIFDTCQADVAQYESTESVFWASGAALFVKAKLFNDMQGFDEAYFAHMEEIDFCWRIKQAGYKVMVCPQAVVYHVGGATLHKSNPRKTYLNFRNNLVLLLKNGSWQYLLWGLPLRATLDTVAAYKMLFSGSFADFWAIFKAHLYCITHFISILKRRKKAQQQVKQNTIGKPNHDGWIKKSVVWAYYLKKQKQFSDFV